MPDDRRDVPETPPDAPQPDARQSNENTPAPHAGGFTLDLSSGPSAGPPEAWRRQRKQASPILTKIVDLSTSKPDAAPPPPEKPKAEKPKPPQDEKRREKREKGRLPGGATLADLLDEATLARLRGKG